MITTTFKRLREAEACTARYHHLAKKIGGVTEYGVDTPITIARVLEYNGLSDALWALAKACDTSDTLERFVVICADHVLPIFEQIYPNDNRPRLAIQKVKDFLNGKIDEKELRAAADAAADAADAAADAVNVAYAAANAVNAADAAYAAEREWQKQKLLELVSEDTR
jgi:hypothetical protein